MPPALIPAVRRPAAAWWIYGSMDLDGRIHGRIHGIHGGNPLSHGGLAGKIWENHRSQWGTVQPATFDQVIEANLGLTVTKP